MINRTECTLLPLPLRKKHNIFCYDENDVFHFDLCCSFRTYKMYQFYQLFVATQFEKNSHNV